MSILYSEEIKKVFFAKISVRLELEDVYRDW